MWVRKDQEEFLDEYIRAASIADDTRRPLFRTVAGKTGNLTDNAMHRVDAYRMIRRPPCLLRPFLLGIYVA